MLFPIIKIKQGNRTHIIGNNSHDCLFIEGNAIHYLNTQGMISTQYTDESNMYFSGQESDYNMSPYPEVEMVTLEDLIEIATQNMVEQTEASLRLHESFRKYLKAKKECEDKRNGDDIRDSSGLLF